MTHHAGGSGPSAPTVRAEPDRARSSWPARLGDRAIAWYQARLSPRKGYACAHRVAHGGDSCSQAVRRSLPDRGVLGSALPTVVRFAACWRAVALLTPQQRVRGVCCCGGIPVPFGFGGR